MMRTSIYSQPQFKSASDMLKAFQAKGFVVSDEPQIVEGDCPIHGHYRYDMPASGVGNELCPTCRKLNALKYEFRQAFTALNASAHEPLLENEEEKTFETLIVSPEMQRNVGIVYRFAGNFPDRLLAGKADSCRGLFLLGPSGAGKSHLASAVCNLLNDYSPVYLSANTLFNIYRSKFCDDFNGMNKRFAKVSLLIIDEIGRSACSDFEANQLQAIIDSRVRMGLPTMLISNLALKSVSQVLGSALASRMKHVLFPLVCDWPDYRERQGRQVLEDGIF